jgi:hypothetical protein
LTSEGLTVAAKKPAAPWKLGDRVKIRHSDLRGRIVELRGPLGPGGANIYRVRFRGKPRPAYVEVREDQLLPIPAEDKVRAPAAHQDRQTEEEQAAEIQAALSAKGQTVMVVPTELVPEIQALIARKRGA